MLVDGWLDGQSSWIISVIIALILFFFFFEFKRPAKKRFFLKLFNEFYYIYSCTLILKGQAEAGLKQHRKKQKSV